MRDFTALKAEQAAIKAAHQKKLVEDKRKGEEMRIAAMEGIASMLQFGHCMQLSIHVTDT